MQESSYGLLKRYNYLKEIIQKYEPDTVLDFGCGTGYNLTLPLATEFPQINFIGVDADFPSLEAAKKRIVTGNISFLLVDELDNNQGYDLVISSEVIEHVDNPTGFLIYLKSLVKPNGFLFLTLPNGYGPFEIASLLDTIFMISKTRSFVKRHFRKLFHKVPYCHPSQDTMAVSPHVNFFSYSHILRLINSCDFKIVDFRSRTFLCGPLFDEIIDRCRLVSINAKVADKLPPQLCSGWMFFLKNSGF